MDSRTLFETTARHWWPEIDLSRDGEFYRVAATRWMYEGWLLTGDRLIPLFELGRNRSNDER